MKKDVVVSAQVVLYPGSGKKISNETLITTKNVSEYLPTSQTIVKASEILVKLGFEVGEMVGISLSITAPVRIFEDTFGLQLDQVENGGIQVIFNNGSMAEDIPQEHWPEELADLAVALIFPPPPDFGPGNY